MGEQAYFVVTNDCEVVNVEVMDRELLAKRLSEKFWGEHVEWLDSFVGLWDIQVHEGAVLIKGEIVQPRQVETVVRQEMP